MDERNAKGVNRKGKKDIPDKTKKDNGKENSEDLKKLGRQVEV